MTVATTRMILIGGPLFPLAPTAGLAAGIAGAVTGCPADAVLTRVNSRPEAADWRAMVKQMLGEEGGWRNLFAGVNVRMVFFSLVISIQFLVYDWFRNLFGVASDDLTVVLDVISSPPPVMPS